MSEVETLYKQACKLCQPSMLSLRLTPDWEAATPMLERAGNMFKATKNYRDALAAYERAAKGQQRLGSSWHAAKDLESAAECAKQLQEWHQVDALTRQAVEAYKQADRIQSAAEAACRGAKSLEGPCIDDAAALYMEGLALLEETGNAHVHADMYRQASAGLVAGGKLRDAALVFMRLAAACDASVASSTLRKAYLGAIVVLLAVPDAKEAWQIYQDALDVAPFATSQHAFAAESLFAAYRTGQAEQVQQALRQHHQYFQDLDSSAARLAKKLPVGNVQAAARQLPAEDCGNSEEVDLR